MSQSLDGEVARLEVEEQRGRGFERPEQAGLADPGRAEDHALDAARLGQPLIGGDDGEAHAWSSCGRIAIFSAPVFTVRAGSKPWRIASGQAA